LEVVKIIPAVKKSRQISKPDVHSGLVLIFLDGTFGFFGELRISWYIRVFHGLKITRKVLEDFLVSPFIALLALLQFKDSLVFNGLWLVLEGKNGCKNRVVRKVCFLGKGFAQMLRFFYVIMSSCKGQNKG